MPRGSLVLSTDICGVRGESCQLVTDESVVLFFLRHIFPARSVAAHQQHDGLRTHQRRLTNTAYLDTE